MLCPSSHPCSEKSAGESLSSLLQPQPRGKTPLSIPQPFQWTSLRPPTGFFSFLSLHCFHMLPYPLNLTQPGRVELSSPGTPRTTCIIPHTNTFSVRLVCLLFHSFTVCISTARVGLHVCVLNWTYKCYKSIWKKLMRKKRWWWRISL